MQETIPSDDAASPAPDPPVDRPPAFGRFTRLQELGRGGMGVVYSAHDELLARAVAIKTIRADRAGPIATARILREAKALARLSHPNVVQLHDASVADGRIFLTMEFVDGRTLRAWLSEKPGRPQILDAFIQAGHGLAAAHAAGLVHRDIKPDNILVGADGRVRVVDFGLVAPRGDQDERRLTQPDVPADETLTRHGAVLGTPGYMAPEQLRGDPADARSDQFCFCVALFEALHGRRPFAAEDGAVTRSAIFHGRVDDDPGDVPAWLHAVLLRGLRIDPAARWPDMPALLAALLRDPQAARRRVLRLTGLLLLVAAAAVLLSLAAVALARHWARERAEHDAEARLLALDAAVRRAEQDDDAAAAEAAFRAFVADPQHAGTRALARAWMRRGDQRRDAADDNAALAAYAEAYVGAREPADATAAMRSLARTFLARGDGPALARTAAVLPPGDPERANLEFTAALLQRDLPAAASVLASAPTTHDDPDLRRALAARPMFTALAGARDAGVRAWDLRRLPPGQRAAYIALHNDPAPFLLDANLRELGPVPVDVTDTILLRDVPWLLARTATAVALLDLTGAPLWRTTSPVGPARAITVDLGGPHPDVLLGWQHPIRGVRRLTGLGGPTPREQLADPAAEHSQSDLESAVAGDLDGDGTRELVVALGGWQAYDLRVFTISADGALVARARRRLGRVRSLVLVPHPDGPRIAAFKDDAHPNPDLFPDPPHTGEPAGVHLLRWTGDELLTEAVIPPRRRDARAFETAHEHGFPADLDGDGAPEIVFTTIATHDAALLLRADPEGWTSWTIDGLRPLAATNLDNDPADELITNIGDDGALWILGAGADILPTLRPPQPRSPLVPDLADPLLAARWTRADDLTAIGLPASAAAGLEEALHFTADPHTQALLRDRSAELRIAAGDDEAALALGRALRSTTHETAALARDAAALARLGRYDEADAAAAALLAHDLRTPAQTDAARALQIRLAPLLGGRALDLDLTRPLADAWRITSPAALRRDHDAGLAFTLVADAQPVASLPLTWSGGPLTLELSAELTRLEHDACMRIALEDPASRPWLAVAVCGGGGGGELTHVARLSTADRPWLDIPLGLVASSATTPRRFTARIAYFPERATAECTLTSAGKTLRSFSFAVDPPAPGHHALTLGSMPSGQPPNLAAGLLRRITLRGAQLAPQPDPDPAETAARLLVDGDAAAARALLTDLRLAHPRHALTRALASDDLHDPTAAASALAPLLADLSPRTPTTIIQPDLSSGPSSTNSPQGPSPATPTTTPDLSPRTPTTITPDLSPRPSPTIAPSDLVLLLRTRPVLAAAIRAHAGPAVLPLLARVWSSLAHHHRRDPATRREVLAALRGVEALTPRTDPDRLALRDLLRLRGRLWEHAGDREQARRDLQAALAVPPIADPADARTRTHLHAELARLLVDSDRPAALAHATVAINEAESAEAMRLRLFDMPAIAARHAVDPAWRALLASPR